MNKLISSIVLSIYFLSAQAEIQVQVTPSEVTVNEPFQLTLTQSNSQEAGVPDLTLLRRDFQILGTARQISYSIVNGQSTSSSEWVITLKPLKPGVLSIPAIKMGQEQSSPMTINVEVTQTAQDDLDAEEQDLMLKTSYQPKTPYINQEILYTVKLYNSKRLLDASYEAPQVENALIIPLGDATRHHEVKNNTSYVVEEQTYAIFPQKSGQLTIASPTFTALVYDIDSQRVSVRDKETKIVVQPIPKLYQHKTWLPAKNVSLKENYEQTAQTLSQGSTLVRTITLEGLGVPAQLLPTLSFKNTAYFNVYPEKGTDKNQVRQGELVGRTEFKVTYLFNKPGDIIIPELTVTWFNTQTGKQEQAILAPRSIHITPANTVSTNATPRKTAPSQAHDKALTKTSQQQPIVTAKEINLWAFGLALFFAGAWITTLILGRLNKGRGFWGKRGYKAALKQLNKACQSANPQEARDALLQWAAYYWPDATILNLTDLSTRVRDPALRKQIQHLSQALYKKQVSSPWRGDELYKAVTDMKPWKNPLKHNSSSLPPINP